MRLLLLLPILLLALVPCHGKTTVHFDESDGLSSHRVGGGIQDHNGLLWFASANGLNCYDGYEFHHIKIRPGDKASVNTNHIRDILLSSDSAIICHTDDDIYRFSLISYTFNDIPPTEKDSLRHLVGKTWTGIADRQGNRWTADRSGLYKSFSPHHPAHILEGTEGHHPRAFLIDDKGNLMIGLRDIPAITTYSSTSGTSSATASSPPYCLLQSSTGDIWVGAKPGGICRLGHEPFCDDAVYDIAEDSFGRLWVATFGNGVKCIPDPSSPTPALSVSSGGRKVRKLLIADSLLIATTTDGLLTGLIDCTSDTLHDTRIYRRDGVIASSLSSNALMSLAKDSRGNIYICTESSGCDMTDVASLLAGNPTFTHFNTATSSLPSDICRAMTMASDSTLIIVGNDNVMLFNPHTDVCVNYNSHFWGDSCRFTEATPLQLTDGSWIFGTEQGAVVASEHNLMSRGYVPPLVFVSCSVNGHPGRFAPTVSPYIKLEANSRNLSVDFAAIDFTDNSGILYRTRFDGSPWTGAVPSRRADLFNLTPGRHLLEVQSTDRYGRWVDNTLRVDIEVEPFWHETVAARVVFMLLAIAFIWAIIYTYHYIRRVNRQRSELLEKYMTLLSADREHHAKTVVTPMPDGNPEVNIFLERVRRFIEENIGNADASVDDMAAAAAVSRSTLNRRLRSSLGISAAQLMTEARMQHAVILLGDGDRSSSRIAEIADMCGYSDPHYFQRVFARKYGCTPALYHDE